MRIRTVQWSLHLQSRQRSTQMTNQREKKCFWWPASDPNFESCSSDDTVMFIVFNYQRPIGSRIPLVEPLGQGYQARDNDGWLGREAQVTECV